MTGAMPTEQRPDRTDTNARSLQWVVELVSRSHPEYYTGAIGLLRPRSVSNEEILNLAADALDDGRITEAENGDDRQRRLHLRGCGRLG